ncbi:hypothetical protein GY45DRAFT_1373880 [Cubamyces sp. BRFM 1775]|nr:hypothetical protein GY45DRAFT_1373880 [Cubamyces sp. BRFM 1775]
MHHDHDDSVVYVWKLRLKANSRREAEEAKMCGKDGVPIVHRTQADVHDEKDARPEIGRSVLREITLDAIRPQDAVRWGHALAFADGLVAVADIVDPRGFDATHRIRSKSRMSIFDFDSDSINYSSSVSRSGVTLWICYDFIREV